LNETVRFNNATDLPFSDVLSGAGYYGHRAVQNAQSTSLFKDQGHGVRGKNQADRAGSDSQGRIPG
jgi:hypothetical protein